MSENTRQRIYQVKTHSRESLLLFLLLLPLLTYAQSSIHQIDYDAHKKTGPYPSYFADTDYHITPFKQKKSSSLTHAIFGYLPDWEYSSARHTLQYDLLTHIAAFDFTVAANGDIANPSYWPWVDVINDAHEHGVKMIITVVNFTTNQIKTLLTNQTSKQNLFENLADLLREYELQGVNIDFENVASADRGNSLNRFMADLTEYLHREVPDSEISFAAPAVNWGSWNLAGLAHSCDYLFIMGYNFYGSWSETTGPSAPLRGGSYNITNTIEDQYAAVVNAEPEKLILGVPYYGDRWQTRTSAAHSATIDHLGHPRYKTAFEESLSHGLKWDFRSQAAWYSYKKNDKFHQVWFETDSSLGMKYDLVLKHQLRGTGMWALGYDGNRSELWDEIRMKFTESTSAKPTFAKTKPSISIFPNPCSNFLSIKYNGAIQNAKFRIFNIQGKELNLKPQIKPGADYSTPNQVRDRLLDISTLPNGIYFIRVGSITKKFIKN